MARPKRLAEKLVVGITPEMKELRPDQSCSSFTRNQSHYDGTIIA